MKVPWALVAWNARRSWPLAAILMLAATLAVAWLLPWSASALDGAPALDPDIDAGLVRQGIWTLGAGLVLTWLVARSAHACTQWRSGEGDWLGSGLLSRGGVALAQCAGMALALLLGFLPFAIAAEWRAGAHPSSLIWLADETVGSVVLLEPDASVQLSVVAPRGAQRLEARFVVAAPGEGGPTALVRASLTPEQGKASVAEVLVGTAAVLGIDVPAGADKLQLRFERAGNGAAVVLKNARVRWFAPPTSRGHTAVALLLHSWIAGSAAAAIALAVAAWASAGTAFLASFAVLVAAWLSTDSDAPWPGIGLRDALALCGDGHGPGFPTLVSWLTALALNGLAVAAIAAQRDLWRRSA
jgi:hypothetical protein